MCCTTSVILTSNVPLQVPVVSPLVSVKQPEVFVIHQLFTVRGSQSPASPGPVVSLPQAASNRKPETVVIVKSLLN